MPIRPRLVAMDLDGTLLDDAHDVTEPTRRALCRARDAGIVLVLATSRGPRAVLDVLHQLSRGVDPVGDLDVIASGGAVLARWHDGELTITDHWPLPLGPAQRVAADAHGRGLAVHWYAGHDWFVSHLDPTTAWEASVVRAEPVVRDLTTCTEGPDKLMMIDHHGTSPVLEQVVDALPPGLAGTPSNPTYLEVTAVGVDKAATLTRLCAARGVAPSDVAAIGDGRNDLSMLTIAGTAIAPANAVPEVLALADLVTASNDEDGVAVALDLLRSRAGRPPAHPPVDEGSRHRL